MGRGYVEVEAEKERTGRERREKEGKRPARNMWGREEEYEER